MNEKQGRESDLKVSQFLADQPPAREVCYSGLESLEEHELAFREMPRGFGGVVSFTLEGGFEAGYELLKRLELVDTDGSGQLASSERSMHRRLLGDRREGTRWALRMLRKCLPSALTGSSINA